jgi:arylsulfatase A-like enzyme
MKITTAIRRVLFLAAIMLLGHAAKAQTTPPNVLFIAIDDLRNFVNCFGYSQVLTPNLDALAERSTIFTNAHNQAPMCGPSRSSVMTGIMPYSSGAYGFVDWREVPVLATSTTLNNHFFSNGYDTRLGGKIYHGNLRKEELTTDGYYSKAKHDGGTWGEEGVPTADRALQSYRGFSKVNGPSDTPEAEFNDTITADLAIDQLQDTGVAGVLGGVNDDPWFLGVGFTKPHLAWTAPRAYFDMYDGVQAPLPENLVLPTVLANDIADTPDAAQFLSYQIHALGIDNDDSNTTPDPYVAARKMLHAYLATITYMDAQLGRVIDALDARADADNTIIIVWSDHGWHLGEKQCWSKFTLWNEATRNPLMISVPGQTTAQVCDKPVQLVDMYPTLSDLAGLPAPASQLDGRSLVPLLNNPNAIWDYPAITCDGRDSYALTFERWKYNRFFDGSEELYDHLNDPLEHTNLADDPSYAAIKAQCAAWLPTQSHPNVSGGSEWMLWIVDYPPLDVWRQEMIDINAGLVADGKVPGGIFRRYCRDYLFALQDEGPAPDFELVDGLGHYVSFQTEEGKTYEIEYTDSISGPWITSPVTVEGNKVRAIWTDDGVTSTTSDPNSAPKRFYRVIVPDVTSSNGSLAYWEDDVNAPTGSNGDIVLATSSKTGVSNDATFGSTDGTYGTAASGATVTAAAMKGKIGETMRIKIENVSSESLQLDTIHFDFAKAFNASPKTITLVYLSGALDDADDTELVSYTASSTIGKETDYDDIDVTLSSVLTDTVLSDGQSATFEFRFSGDVGETGSSGLDNVAVFGTQIF